MGRCWIESWGAEFVGGYGFDTTGSEDLALERPGFTIAPCGSHFSMCRSQAEAEQPVHVGTFSRLPLGPCQVRLQMRKCLTNAHSHVAGNWQKQD